MRWRGRSIPEIPLIQPERAAAPPLAITFDKTYRYRLRGAETIEGRDCWVVEFAPAGAAGEEGKLHRGTVWVDREVYARVRTRAVQLGLTGEVLSNEETQHFRPIDAAGAPAEWTAPEAFVLPLRVVSNQLWSVVNATTQVERETVLSAVTINDPAFDARRRQVADTDVTMLRDTERGLRYLVKDPETGERVVQEEFDTSKWFLAGGVFPSRNGNRLLKSDRFDVADDLAENFVVPLPRIEDSDAFHGNHLNRPWPVFRHAALLIRARSAMPYR